MVLFTPEEIEPEILNDLKEEIIELYENSIQNLVELELTPHDNEMQRALFRSVHTIKGDLGLVGFLPMIEVLQYLEDILDMLRKGEITYSTPLHDFVVRLLDKVTTFVEDCVNKGQAEYDKQAIDKASGIIHKIVVDNKEEHTSLLLQAIKAFSGYEDEQKNAPECKAIQIPKTGVPKNIDSEQQQDILFFRDLMRTIEKRLGFSEGHGDRIAGLALYINGKSTEPLEEVQLAVACYVKDFGLAFMPQNVATKKGELTELEQNLLRSHVYKSTRLLEHLSLWDGARKIIMQHHEYKDGSGYPLGVKGDEICGGASLLNIVETYVNLVGEPIVFENEVNSLISLNKDYKGKFNTKWLRLFNNAMTEYLNSQPNNPS